MKATEFRKLIKEEIKNALKEDQGGLITFEQVKQACIKNYMSYKNEDDYPGITKKEINEFNLVTDIDELAGTLDELGFNGIEAYNFIFDSILK